MVYTSKKCSCSVKHSQQTFPPKDPDGEYFQFLSPPGLCAAAHLYHCSLKSVPEGAWLCFSNTSFTKQAVGYVY